MKRMLLKQFVLVGLIVLMISSGANANSGANVVPIPPGPPTILPDYSGRWPRRYPAANSGVPQNPLLAPNGFNSCHLDFLDERYR